MITAEQAKNYTKEFEPDKDLVRDVENQIKNGERHIRVYTTKFFRSYAEDFAKYCRSLGYSNARIEDIYNMRTGAKGGNYLAIDL